MLVMSCVLGIPLSHTWQSLGSLSPNQLTTIADTLRERLNELQYIHSPLVVLGYLRDRNPQADLQAMDRVHRTGQTKQVYVFRSITEGSVKETMLERVAQKISLLSNKVEHNKRQRLSSSILLVCLDPNGTFCSRGGQGRAIRDDYAWCGKNHQFG
jgi:hypothetical protein